MVAQEREAGAQKQEERRIEECQIDPASVAMQCQLQQPMRLADVGLRRMAIERQLPGGPEADEIAESRETPGADACHCTHNTQKLRKATSASASPATSM